MTTGWYYHLHSETMFDVHGHFRRRVHIARKGGGLSVRIERQNARAGYFWVMCLGTVMFGFFCNMLWGASVGHPHDVLYATLPMFVLVLSAYILALATGIWGAFGVEEVSTKSGSLRWTRTALKWTRTSDIPLSEITEIRAISHWHGDNTVAVNTTQKQRRIGDRLLRDEASELAKHLRHAVGLTK
jgi:hypothetical protein